MMTLLAMLNAFAVTFGGTIGVAVGLVLGVNMLTPLDKTVSKLLKKTEEPTK